MHRHLLLTFNYKFNKCLSLTFQYLCFGVCLYLKLYAIGSKEHLINSVKRKLIGNISAWSLVNDKFQ